MQWIIAAVIFVIGIACIAAGSQGNAADLFEAALGFNIGNVLGTSSGSSSASQAASSKQALNSVIGQTASGTPVAPQKSVSGLGALGAIFDPVAGQ